MNPRASARRPAATLLVAAARSQRRQQIRLLAVRFFCQQAHFVRTAGDKINVPAVVIILEVWRSIPEGTLVGLAILSTLGGNLLLVGSLANLITAERALLTGVRLSFRDHAKTGVPITILSMLLAGLWL